MIQIGNSFALLALLGWPLVAVMLFKRLPLERALIWSILAAYMFLPQVSEINLPAIPAFDKVTIPNLMAFALCLGIWGKRPDIVPQSIAGRILLVMFIVSPAITVLTNLEPVEFGVDQFGSLRLVDPNALERWGLPGLRVYDSLSALAQQVFLMLPFFLARAVLRSEAAIREILLALVIAGAIYALPMLWEVRFSPQLHTQVYGFFQHSFAQAMRDGGFRPFVFMPHGLWVAFFAFMCAMAAAAWVRDSKVRDRGKRLMILGLMALLVVICKSLGALVFTLAFVPMVLLFKPRVNVTIAAGLAVLVLAYPLLRGSGVVPTQQMVASLAPHNAERAQSLEYRFDNEDDILAHVEAKPLFGWGGWGRFMVYDPRTGESQTVVDGQWIITIGHYGWLGFIALFGLLAMPLLGLWWQARKPQAPPIPVAVSTLALILAVNMVDLLPNATLIPFTWLMAGALLGYVEDLRHANKAARAANLRKAHAGVVLGVPTLVPPEPEAPKARRSVL
ncbi:hypothetical protein [Pararhodobacter oceanensis]|uniref:hypothetical protein n=1 Tax=Pararhodobacter oceanensis TaxID=2172121 RepID=UPI00197FBACA|nr:hypothetical protein [Pararhodobacter oceanensis]